MEFEFDKNKSVSNKQKHGINLEEASALWAAPHIEIAKTLDEPRFMVIGKVHGKFYSCVYTTRGVGIIRLISARRSRKAEEVIYHEPIKT